MSLTFSGPERGVMTARAMEMPGFGSDIRKHRYFLPCEDDFKKTQTLKGPILIVHLRVSIDR